MDAPHLITHHLGRTVWQLAGIAALRLAVIALLVTTIVLFVHAITRRTARRSPAAAASTAAAAELLLDERFARGEIDAEEYQNRRRVLQRSPHW